MDEIAEQLSDLWCKNVAWLGVGPQRSNLRGKLVLILSYVHRRIGVLWSGESSLRLLTQLHVIGDPLLEIRSNGGIAIHWGTGSSL
jgi:hypothetical protein